MRSVLVRHPVAAMVLLSYAVSWSLLPFGTFLPFGPLVSALVVVAVTEGRRGLRRWALRIVRWRVGWVWYAAAIGLPVAAHALTQLECSLSGVPSPSLPAGTTWYSLVLIVALRLVSPLDGALGEEPGWRGFAQPRLQARRSPLRATAILCLIVCVWHLPLYLLPGFGLRPFEALTTISCTVVYAWLFNRSGGSVLIPLLAHAVEGTVRLSTLWTADADIVAAKLWYSLSWASIAAAVLLLDRPAWISAPASAREPAPDADASGPELTPLAGGRATS
jgi:membrane protease YdiL (CAAX protease family)